MTFVLAAAAGAEAVQSLRTRLRNAVARGEAEFVEDGDYAVAWAPSCKWIDIHDDGDVAVILDGRLHGSDSVMPDQAKSLMQRYRDRGLDVAEGVLGDFVFIVLDRSRGRLLVARDPVGVRPWYYAGGGRRVAGASDVATLTSLPWVDTTVNEPMAIRYLAAVTASRGETIYRGIRTLSPGSTWHDRAGRSAHFPHHRWDFRPDLDVPFDEAAERCRRVFDKAVACRLDATAPATSELSGGLDSSIVVGTMVGLGRTDVMVGRLVFGNASCDERPYSDAVIDRWKVSAVSAPPWVPSLDESSDLTGRLERPVPDPHFTMFVSLHRRFSELSRWDGLTGLGGDDAFVASSIGSRIVSALQLRQRPVLGELVRTAVRRRARAWPELLRPTLHHAAPWKGAALPPWVRSAAATSAGLPALFRRPAERVTGIAAIDERIDSLIAGYTAAILEDRAVVTDIVGRRESHPFLDPRLVEATYALDPWWSTRNGSDRALEVEAFRDRLPPMVAERRSKVEFSNVFWPQLLVDELLGRVRSGPLHDFGWLDRVGFDALVARAKGGTANAAIPLARCVHLDRWARTQ